MSCQFSLKSRYLFFLQRSKYFISCLMIATFSLKRIILLCTKFSKMLSASVQCHFPRMNTSILPGSGPAQPLFAESIRIHLKKTFKLWEAILTMPCYASLPNQYLSRIISLKSSITKSQTTVSHFFAILLIFSYTGNTNA